MTEPKTTKSALKIMTEANFMLISVDGLYAPYEAHNALDNNCNVMIASANITLDEEVELKRKAKDKGLFMLGPDASTAIINGKGIGFANSVKRGGIGIAGTGNSGIQAASVIIDKEGLGISHAIGAGSRDLSAAVSGIMTELAMNALNEDISTRVILLISNLPNKVAADKMIDISANFKKPVVACFTGFVADKEIPKNVFLTKTIEEAALFSCALYRKERLELVQFKIEKNSRAAGKFSEDETNGFTLSSKYLRAFYSGGTLAQEALFMLKDKIGDIYSNFKGGKSLMDPRKSTGNTIIDLGDFEITKGKTNPLIDYAYKCERLQKEAESEDTAVVLFDVILGHCACADPSAYLVPALRGARQYLKGRNRNVVFIAYICGTDQDAQDYSKQEKALTDEGVIVLPTNAACVRLAGNIIEKLRQRKTIFAMN